MKQTIRLNEAQLKRVVAESVKRVLNENDNWNGFHSPNEPNNWPLETVKGNNNTQGGYSVWAGGTEVNDYHLSKDEAIRLAEEYLDDGYDDVQIVKN